MNCFLHCRSLLEWLSETPNLGWFPSARNLPASLCCPWLLPLRSPLLLWPLATLHHTKSKKALKALSLHSGGLHLSFLDLDKEAWFYRWTCKTCKKMYASSVSEILWSHHLQWFSAAPHHPKRLTLHRTHEQCWQPWAVTTVVTLDSKHGGSSGIQWWFVEISKISNM